MLNKKIDVLSSLVEIYKDLYAHKDLFNVNFKYSPNEVENFYKQIQPTLKIEDIEKTKEKEGINEDILALKTTDDIKEYFMKWSSDDNLSKEDLIKKLSLNEFGYIYTIIFSSPLKSNMRKIDALNAIEKFFTGISRAVSMKPYRN
jgi:DNA repair exonuclease SbcCD ATPase subunit